MTFLFVDSTFEDKYKKKEKKIKYNEIRGHG